MNPAAVVAKSKSKNHHLSQGEIHETAVQFGALGGLIGGQARANALSSKRREEIARHAANVRWGNVTR